MLSRSRLKFVISALILVFLISLGGNLSASSINLSIVYSDSLRSTIRTIKGIKSTISRHYDATVYYEHLLTSDKNEIEKQLKNIDEINPKLILTIGSYTTEIISERIKNKPIVFSAVLNPETSGFVQSLQRPGGNISGASLDIPPDIQFKYFKRVKKDLKRIGVLYSDETANLIPPAKVLAQQAGLELHAIKITSPKDIPDALEQLNNKVDGLWSVADANIYSPRSTRFILLNTLRNGKPFMGFSANLVESGALFGLDYDYKDIGRQAGKIAMEVLAGKPPANIPVAVPGIIWFHCNEKTAGHIGVELPEDLIAVAKEVYR